MEPPVTVVNRYAAFEDEVIFPDATHCVFESTISGIFPNAEIDQLS